MILDTSGLSAWADGNLALAPILRKAAGVAVPVIVLGEYRYGIRGSRHRVRYELWLSQALERCDVLAIDAATTESYADVREELTECGTPIPSNDLWIAALARQHGLPVLTRDRHFDFVPGLERISW